jgi:hypothetical protein
MGYACIRGNNKDANKSLQVTGGRVATVTNDDLHFSVYENFMGVSVGSAGQISTLALAIPDIIDYGL